MIEIAKLEKMLQAENAASKLFAELSAKEIAAYELATGVKDTQVYSGPEGTIHRQDMLSGTQYRATHKNKGHYHASQRGAMSWLKKQHAKTQSKDAK